MRKLERKREKFPTDALRECLDRFEQADLITENGDALYKKSRKGKEMLMRLFEYYVKHSDRMPALYRRNCEEEGVERCVCDFVSGMTDRYAIELYSELYVPKVWRGAHT